MTLPRGSILDVDAIGPNEALALGRRVDHPPLPAAGNEFLVTCRTAIFPVAFIISPCIDVHEWNNTSPVIAPLIPSPRFATSPSRQRRSQARSGKPGGGGTVDGDLRIRWPPVVIASSRHLGTTVEINRKVSSRLPQA